MLVNLGHLEKKDINSKVCKVRAVIMNYEGKFYVTNMDNSYNLPGGRVEAHEDLKDALIRELKEELGIKRFNILGILFFGTKIFLVKRSMLIGKMM